MDDFKAVIEKGYIRENQQKKGQKVKRARPLRFIQNAYDFRKGTGKIQSGGEGKGGENLIRFLSKKLTIMLWGKKKSCSFRTS